MRKKTDVPEINQSGGAQKKKAASWWIRTLAVSVPVMVVAVSASKLFGNQLSDTHNPNIEQSYVSEDVPQLDPNAGKYVEPEKEETASKKGVSVPGWQSLSIPENQKEVSVDFYNPESNEGQYQLTFELRLPDESEQGYEVLYKSGLIDPGLHVQNITLSRGLEEGTYDAIIHVQPYRMDEQKTPTNNADMQTQLIVS